MQRRLILALVSIAMALGACARSGEYKPQISALPSDLQICAREPSDVPDRELTVEEIETLWKTDRARLARVNACYRRLLCLYADNRREIAGVDEALCRKE